jgi:hypothetical protein
MDGQKRNMEQRGEHRHTLALDTEVYFQESHLDGMVRCRSKNIGLGGVFLPTDSLPITDHAQVELVFLAGTRPVPRQYRMQAEGVRTTEQGAALSFAPLDEEQSRSFRHFLLRAKIAARH